MQWVGIQAIQQLSVFATHFHREKFAAERHKIGWNVEGLRACDPS